MNLLLLTIMIIVIVLAVVTITKRAMLHATLQLLYVLDISCYVQAWHDYMLSDDDYDHITGYEPSIDDDDYASIQAQDVHACMDDYDDEYASQFYPVCTHVVDVHTQTILYDTACMSKGTSTCTHDYVYDPDYAYDSMHTHMGMRKHVATSTLTMHIDKHSVNNYARIHKHDKHVRVRATHKQYDMTYIDADTCIDSDVHDSMDVCYV